MLATEGAGTTDAAVPFSPTNVQGHDGVFSNKNAYHATRTSQGSPMNGGQSTHGLNDYASTSGYREGPRLFNRDSFVDRQETQQSFGNGTVSYGANGQLFGQSQPTFGSQLDNRPLHAYVPDRQPVAPLAQQRSIQQGFIPSPISSPWPPQDPATVRRPGPFDADYPTSRNTAVTQPLPAITPSQSFPQPLVNPSSHVVTSQSPWFTASQGAVSDGWTSDSLTAANLGHHNRLQEEESRQQEPHHASVAESPIVVDPVPQPESSPEPPAPTAVDPDTPPSKRRRKPSSQPLVAPSPSPAKPASSPVVTTAATKPKPPSPTPQVVETSKQPAWGTGDDEKKKSATAALGLREIQEMETKKSEARKAAERERERVARAATAASSSTEEIQTLSWGLPTSQAGTRSTISIKEPTAPQSAPSPVVSSSPVWTNAAKVPVVKKTMKEIQEEEEKRKKIAAKEKETVAAAARRAYADTTTKVGLRFVLS